jgi:hypothetical protein
MRYALWFQARNVATMVVNNASFNCNAAKMLITSRAWPQRGRFLDMIGKALGEVVPRRAYYPGAKERYAELIGDRSGVMKIGTAGPDELPWALITGVDATSSDPLFQNEPFCGVISRRISTSPTPRPSSKRLRVSATSECGGRSTPC